MSLLLFTVSDFINQNDGVCSGVKQLPITMGCNQSSENQWAYANDNAPIKNVSKKYNQYIT